MLTWRWKRPAVRRNGSGMGVVEDFLPELAELAEVRLAGWVPPQGLAHGRPFPTRLERMQGRAASRRAVPRVGPWPSRLFVRNFLF